MALSEVIICNMALAHLGVARQLTSGTGLIASVVQDNDYARFSAQFYDKCRDEVLTDFAWPFAAKYLLLTLASDGDDEVWEGEWGNAYVYPTDCLVVRRFLTNALTQDAWWTTTTPHDFQNPPFEIKTHAGAQVIFTDVEEDLAAIEYTAKITDATLYPIRFGVALAWRLAFDLGSALRVEPQLLVQVMRVYQLEVDAARRSAGNEDDPRAEDDGSFIRARNC